MDTWAILKDLFSDAEIFGDYNNFYLDNSVKIEVVCCRSGVRVWFEIRYTELPSVYFSSRFLSAEEAEVLYPMSGKLIGSVGDLLD